MKKLPATMKPLLCLLALLACGSVTSQGGSLYLHGPVAQQGVLNFTIEGGEPDGIYDFYWHHSLGATNGWIHLARTEPGQTNLVVVPGTTAGNFFTLGTQQDSDGDTLPDAYEELVLRTDPAQAHTAATLAAAGLNAALLDDVPSELRVSQIELSRRRIDTWGPCQPNTAPQYLINTTAWKFGQGGTNSHYYGYGTCEDNQPGTNYQEVRTIWDTNNVATESRRDQSTSWSDPQPTSLAVLYSPWVKFYFHLESYPHAGLLRTLDNTGAKKLELATGGPRLSSQTWPWIVRGNATELVYGLDNPFQTTTNIVPPTSITLAGTNLDATGTAVVLLRDNTTNDFTPVITGPITNYLFGASAQKVKITLAFSGSGPLTEREHLDESGHLVGCDPTIYFNLTNLLLTTMLGTTNGPRTNGMYFNFQQTSATVPTNAMFDGIWKFHRDRQRSFFFWYPNATNQVVPDANPGYFSPGTPGEGNGNDDPGGPESDITPDFNRLILSADAPGLAPPIASAQAAPPGTIVTMKFFAREWLTWNDRRVSDILRWRSVITYRRKDDLSWERKGTNVIEQLPEGASEIPSFTPAEALQISQEP